jgi:hypothetical protein
VLGSWTVCIVLFVKAIFFVHDRVAFREGSICRAMVIMGIEDGIGVQHFGRRVLDRRLICIRVLRGFLYSKLGRIRAKMAL